MTVHHFEETIGGRRYEFEVRQAQGGRWRACLVPLAGVPTALMPSYGATPQEAVTGLVTWLAQAYSRVPAASAPRSTRRARTGR